MSYKSLKYAILAVPFLLSACGEGYEMVRTDEIFPYGNQRTAGSTIAYVRAKLMPEKELKLEQSTMTVNEEENTISIFEAPGVAPSESDANALKQLEQDVEKMFREKQRK